MFDNFTHNAPTKPSARTPIMRGKWLSDADAVLSSLERDDKKDNDVQNLLRQAQEIITRFETRITEQTNRIEELKRLSTTDELTGITNRRGFMQAFARELDRVNRDKSQGGLLIMIDLDNFKSINDAYGHEAGDAALKVIASTLASDIRTMDIVGRLGGDEFTILFVNTTRKDALERAQFLIKKLNNISFIWKGTEIDVRASLGLKEYGKGSKAENIFSAADASMYENKQQLKNITIKQDNKRMS